MKKTSDIFIPLHFVKESDKEYLQRIRVKTTMVRERREQEQIAKELPDIMNKIEAAAENGDYSIKYDIISSKTLKRLDEMGFIITSLNTETYIISWEYV